MSVDLKIILIIALAICLCCALPGWCKLEKVRLKSVDITGSFWTELQKRNRDISVPHQYDMLKETRRLEALSGRWNGKKTLSPEEKEIAKKTGEPHYFWDSDVAKWIEAAAYVLAKERDPVLEKQVDDIVEGIEKTQLPDGYVNSYFVYVEPENRFRDLRAKHELYCAGHLMEAAVAYYEATGKDRFLNCMRRYADHIGNVFGREKGRLRGYPGHEEIELALVRMYECTGKRDYLELADFFLTERGKQPCYFDLELGEDPKLSPPDKYYWAQAHMPVRRQREAVGHAVRAQYLYSGMTDVGSLKNDRSLLSASRALWKDVTEKKQYITGGVGSDPNTEGISITPYLLPNKTAYCEACASAAFIFWTRRLLAAGPRAEYADKIEKTLYNALLSAMSEDGSRYFYVNPLESDGGHHRSGWFGCSCCPPNIARLIADLGEYIYGVDGKAVYIHQYIGSAARIGATVIEMDTDYPFEDTVRIKATGGEATLCFRLPSWCGSPSCVINGKETPLKKGKNGYASLKHKGESEIVLTFPMDIVFNTAHPAIEDDRNKLCVTCGPLVYCAEETDNGRLDALAVIKGGAVKTDKALFGKYPVIRARGFDLEENKERELSLIPYYLWDNREPGAMKVWIPEYKE